MAHIAGSRGTGKIIEGVLSHYGASLYSSKVRSPPYRSAILLDQRLL